eukprot:gnl/MRDRNA2_/MRDRNA2_297337_c0_seq1.p2 gnl/MRDRNA2_/MRDRNA2_297337_c0~~gnl/MRDRNA2_/MRDRNA2_297337_c0_seq1.p2  ORF type:complete len:115 (-),score=4.51 gnl/MRDRNA2_/MRDRNA2_297337_c0_seq1:10-354(-)
MKRNPFLPSMQHRRVTITCLLLFELTISQFQSPHLSSFAWSFSMLCGTDEESLWEIVFDVVQPMFSVEVQGVVNIGQFFAQRRTGKICTARARLPSRAMHSNGHWEFQNVANMV